MAPYLRFRNITAESTEEDEWYCGRTGLGWSGIKVDGKSTVVHRRESFYSQDRCLPSQERDMHSGLIGPLLICRTNTLNPSHGRQVTVQEFALFFTIFDETKSWYFTENMERNCRAPCNIQMEDPAFKQNNRFHGNISPTQISLTEMQHALRQMSPEPEAWTLHKLIRVYVREWDPQRNQ